MLEYQCASNHLARRVFPWRFCTTKKPIPIAGPGPGAVGEGEGPSEPRASRSPSTSGGVEVTEGRKGGGGGGSCGRAPGGPRPRGGMPAGAAGRGLLAYELLAGRLEGAERTARAGAGGAGAVAPARESFQHLFDSEILRLVAGYRVWSSELCSAVEAQKEALRALEDRLAASGAFGEAHPDAEYPREGRGKAPSSAEWQLVGDEAQRWRDLAAELTSLLEWVTVNLHGVSKIMLMYSRGPLAPLSPQEEHTMFEFHHSSLPNGKIRQHTFMNEEAAQEIQAMGRKIHPQLVAAGTVIRSALYRLHNARKGLCPSSHATSSAAQPSRVPETQGTSSWPNAQRIMQLANRRHLYGVLKDVDAEIRRFDRCERSLLKDGHLGNSLSFRSAGVLNSLEQAEIHAGEDLAFELHSHSFPARAGIFQPPPPDYRAFATNSGLLINLASTFLYMSVPRPARPRGILTGGFALRLPLSPPPDSLTARPDD